MLPTAAPSPTRCEAHTRLYRRGVLVAEGFDVSDVSEHLADPDAVVWLDLLQPDESDMAVLVDELGLHPLAIEDALHAHQRPKFDRYPDHMFLAAYAVVEENGELETAEVAAFLTRRALVTVRKDPRVDLKPVLDRWDFSPDLAAEGVAFLAYGLVDVLVDGYVAVVEDLDDRGEDLEDAMFAETSEEAVLQRQTFALRTSVARMRRLIWPMREVVMSMRRRENGLAGGVMEPYWHDVEDHLLRVHEAVEALRELLSTVLDTTLALQGQRLNETIFKLTAYAAILAVTTAITGFFGQNVPFPGSQEQSGFYASMTLLIGSVVGLVVYFKKRGWL